MPVLSQSAELCQHACSYEVVLKHQDTKGQLMSLQQTLRQEIHAKIGAQTAEESAKRTVRSFVEAPARAAFFAESSLRQGRLTHRFSPMPGLLCHCIYPYCVLCMFNNTLAACVG